MNTLYYYWSQVAYDKAQERRIRDLHNDPNLDPDNYMVPIEGAPGPGVMDLFFALGDNKAERFMGI